MRTSHTNDTLTHLYHNLSTPTSNAESQPNNPAWTSESVSSRGEASQRTAQNCVALSSAATAGSQNEPASSYRIVEGTLDNIGARVDGKFKTVERGVVWRLCENCEVWISPGSSRGSQYTFTEHYLSGVCRDTAKRLVKKRDREGTTKPRDSKKKFRKSTLSTPSRSMTRPLLLVRNHRPGSNRNANEPLLQLLLHRNKRRNHNYTFIHL